MEKIINPLETCLIFMIKEIEKADVGLPAQLLLLVPEEEVGRDGGVDEVRLVLGRDELFIVLGMTVGHVSCKA